MLVVLEKGGRKVYLLQLKFLMLERNLFALFAFIKQHCLFFMIFLRTLCLPYLSADLKKEKQLDGGGFVSSMLKQFSIIHVVFSLYLPDSLCACLLLNIVLCMCIYSMLLFLFSVKTVHNKRLHT